MRVALVSAVVLVACAPTRNVVVSLPHGPAAPTETPVARPPVCRFHGRWALGSVRGIRDRVAFAEVSEARADGELTRQAEGPVLRLRLQHEGWTLTGTGDLVDGSPLRPQAMLALSDVVTAHVGADVVVRDVRAGEVLITPSGSMFGTDDGVRFLVEPARWVPCDQLGFDFTYRDDETEARERAALGVPETASTRSIGAGAAADLAATPGGPVQVHVGPRDFAIGVRVLEARGAFSRVLVQHWTGVSITAWLPAAALGSEEEGGNHALLGMSGSRPQRLTICRATADVPFQFTHLDAPPEDAGTIGAGTEFLRGGATSDGGFAVAPYPVNHAVRPASGVTWVAHPTGPLTCRTVTE